jgi:hypothetical protein
MGSRSKTAKHLADQARADGQPRKERYPLHNVNGGITTAVLKRAVKEAGHDPDDPGGAEHYWYESKDMVVIDLRPDDA